MPSLWVLAAIAVIGCSTMGAPGDGDLRLYRGRDLEPVVAAVFDALPAAGVRFAEARGAAGGQGAIVRGTATVPGSQPVTLILEVSITQTGGAVRVEAGAEPAGGGLPSFEGPIFPWSEAPAADVLLRRLLRSPGQPCP